MKNLIEISRIVTKKKVRKIEIFDDATLQNPNGKFGMFYEALISGKFKNDRDAATFLYKCSPTDDKYRQLKSRFRKRLLNTLFFIDINVPNTSSYDRAYFSTHKDWTLVKILLANNASATATDLARQILSIALKYKFADVIVNCSRILRQYAAEVNEEKAFDEYDQLVKEYSNVLEAEMQSEELFQRVQMKFRDPALDLAGLKEKVGAYCDELIILSERFSSPVIFYNMYLVWTYRYEMLRDFNAMLEVCNRGEKFIEENPLYYQDDKLATFQVKKMSAYLHLRDFKTGKTTTEKSLQTFPEGSEIWFLFMEYYLLLSLHTDNYIQSLAIFNRARNHSKFKKLNYQTREKWMIYNVYLNYILEQIDRNEALLSLQPKKTFNLARFLNDPILYPRELRVFTVHLVIGQILFLLSKKNFTAAAERIDRLRGYATKQLSKEANYRMIQFIRLLQQLARARFEMDELSGHEKYYDRLISHPFFYRGLINEMEIIPYEKLWNHILDKLKI